MTDNKPGAVSVGDRYETTDKRDEGRVVEVTQALGIPESIATHIANLLAKPQSERRDAEIARVRARRTYYLVRTEAHPKNPDAIGNVSRVSEKSLLGPSWRKVSR